MYGLTYSRICSLIASWMTFFGKFIHSFFSIRNSFELRITWWWCHTVKSCAVPEDLKLVFWCSHMWNRENFDSLLSLPLRVCNTTKLIQCCCAIFWLCSISHTLAHSFYWNFIHKLPVGSVLVSSQHSQFQSGSWRERISRFDFVVSYTHFFLNCVYFERRQPMQK